MNFFKQIERIERVDKHIKQRATGNPEKFALKLNISKRQLYRMIDELKDYGAPIEYSRALETFYYKQDSFEIKVNFKIRFISGQEEKEIFGGYLSKNILPCHFLARYKNKLALQ